MNHLAFKVENEFVSMFNMIFSTNPHYACPYITHPVLFLSLHRFFILWTMRFSWKGLCRRLIVQLRRPSKEDGVSSTANASCTSTTSWWVTSLTMSTNKSLVGPRSIWQGYTPNIHHNYYLCIHVFACFTITLNGRSTANAIIFVCVYFFFKVCDESIFSWRKNM